MSTRTARLRLALAAAIAGIAALRLLISIVPDTIFDVDPFFTGIAYSGIGPAASVALDAVLLLLVAITLEVERRGKGLDGWLLLLLVIPVGPIMFHSIGSRLISGGALTGLLPRRRLLRLRTLRGPVIAAV